MSEAAKKRRIEEVEIIVGKKNPRLFLVSKEKADGIVRILSEDEAENSRNIPVEEVFPELKDDVLRPAAVLRGFRLRDGWTQTEVARKLGCPQSWISQMEHAKRPIGKKMAVRLAKIFRTGPEIFR